ncbi:hypothetical protein BU26DRAFT_559364 [Trematosphaeria pertusa]|uniref:Uncharacterized protein n=1 Tax=Trematosphaeria pertusa TaxID=390896 RepID=A0A6A6IXP6_9PLEO|nr:uncharacterized protein BU26DRAFT_559364 [Trematosphaeria pertusa]KAF2254702.1 hypothetical protein BU26DRAFT_559364 [Trematosphaeria pertusa]
MAPITTTLLALIVAALPATVTATQAQTWSGTSCNSGDHLFWSGHSIDCQQLGNVHSLSIDSLDSGCTITYYSDSSCSNDATSARVGSCWGYNTGGPIQSWSWDC